MDDKLKIKVIVGSTRKGRFSDKPALWMYEEIKKMDGIDADLLDLRDYPMPFLEEETFPSASGGRYSNRDVQRWSNKIEEADAFVIVTPEYNHGYPAVLKNALDHLYKEWNKKPVGFISYGGVAGARSVEQLRLVSLELQMIPIRNAIHIPAYWNLLDEKGNLKIESLQEKVESFLSQLILWGKLLKQERNSQR